MMPCDHVTTRASFAAFFAATKLLGGQDLGDGMWSLLGNCVGCNTTLAIQIAEPRGSAVHGEIGPDAKAMAVEGQDVLAPGAVPQQVTSEITPAGRRAFGETAEQHAERIIR